VAVAVVAVVADDDSEVAFGSVEENTGVGAADVVADFSLSTDFEDDDPISVVVVAVVDEVAESVTPN